MSGHDYTRMLQEETGDHLVQALLEAPPALLNHALENPALNENQLLLLLRRVDIGADLLESVMQRKEWASVYLIKAAVVCHPHTPKTVAMNLVKFLFWRDLAKVIGNYQIHAAVRRLSEVMLRDRIHEISLGERIALARMAPRELIKRLRLDRDERVVRALLDNPRLTEDDAFVIANNASTPPAILTILARSERWVSRPNVRLALIRNPRTAPQNSLPLLTALPEMDLRGLLELPTISSLLRSAVGKYLEKKFKRSTGG